MSFFKKQTSVNRVAPHLPKEVRQKGVEGIAMEKWFLRLFLLAVIFGFVSGIVGGMVVNSSFFDNWFWGEGGVWKANTGVIRSESKNLSRDNLSRRAFGVILEIYPVGAVGKDGLLDKDKKLAGGFFLTSNGYAATVKSLFEKYSRKDLVAVTAEQKILQLEKVFLDPISDLAIFKVNVSEITTLPFLYEDDIYSDLDLYLPAKEAGLISSKVVSPNFWQPFSKSDYYFSSEQIYRAGILRDSFDSRFAGSPLINNRGELAGMILDVQDKAVKFNLFVKSPILRTAITQILDNGEIRRAYLGANFLEAGQKLALDGKNSERGIILTNNPRNGALYLEKKSPLIAVGLKIGDIIVGVGDEVISAVRSLPEILSEYQPGTKVNIKFERNRVENAVSVELGKIISIIK